MTKRKNRLTNFERALSRLKEAVAEAESELEIDGAIQRFEFTYELYWKLLKDYLQTQGIRCQSPRSCFKEAYRLGLIEDETAALKMLEDRNETVHLYDEETSRAVYQRIRETYLDLFESVHRRLEHDRKR